MSPGTFAILALQICAPKASSSQKHVLHASYLGDMATTLLHGCQQFVTQPAQTKALSREGCQLLSYMTPSYVLVG